MRSIISPNFDISGVENENRCGMVRDAEEIHGSKPLE
jgi:hypothetical protein